MDKLIVSKVLAIIERDLRTDVLPDMQTPANRLRIDYMTRLLRWLSIEVVGHAELDALHARAIDDLLSLSPPVSTPAAMPSRVGTRAMMDAETIEKLQALGATADSDIFSQFVALQQAHVAALDADGGAAFGDIYQGGRVENAPSAIPVRIDEDRLTAYLRQHFPAYPHAVARDVTPLAGGFGKDTILFQLDDCGVLDGSLVIRKDFIVPPGPTGVTQEFGLLEKLYQQGLPVAKPLWAEEDAAHLGGAFIVSQRVPGTTDISTWAQDQHATRHFVDRLAQTLARIHAIAPTVLDGPDIDARTAVLDNMQLYYDHYRRRASGLHERLEVAFAWLWTHLPASRGTSARLVHGDVGFHNVMTANGRIEALLDWEFAHFGDPAEDIGYCWQFIEALVEWDMFMAMYQRHGGTPPSRQAADFYRVWGDVRNACMGVGATGTLMVSPHADIRSPAAGLTFTPLCEIQALGAAEAWNRAWKP